MLEVVHLGPGVAEVYYPAHSGEPLELEANKVHRLGRTGGDHCIYRIVFQILAKEPHRRVYPAYPWVGNKQVTPKKYGELLLEALFLLVQGVHSGALVGRLEETLVYGVWLADVRLYNGNVGRDVLQQAFVHRKLLGILRGVYYALPAETLQVFGELDPALDAAASGGRPVICYYEYFLHIICLPPPLL